MLSSKYIILNIQKNIKIYITLFFIAMLSFFTLMCVFSIRENVLSIQKECFGKYSVVAFTHKNGNIDIQDDDFIEKYTSSDYVTDYYAFSQISAISDVLMPVPYDASVQRNQYISFFPEDVENSYTVLIYTDISKSSHFRIGSRELTEGRFAENLSECNVSEDFAALNNLRIGDIVDISIFLNNPVSFNPKIVGIFKDSTDQVINELELVYFKKTGETKLVNDPAFGIIEAHSATIASNDNVARNQILTAAPSSRDLKNLNTFTLYGKGFGMVVCYTRNELDIFAYIDTISSELQNQFTIFDSADTARFLHRVLDKTAASFSWTLIVTGLICVLFSYLIIASALNSRVYDIGVLRTRGLSKVKTSGFITAEILIVFTAAFMAASAIYYAVFSPFAEWVYSLQQLLVDNDMVFRRTLNWLAIDKVKFGYTFNAAVLNTALIYGFIAVLAFTFIIGFAASLFIARHEPMKTMTEV